MKKTLVLRISEVIDHFIKQVVKPLIQSQTLIATINQFNQRGILNPQTAKQLFENTGKLRHLTECDYFRIQSTVAPEAGFQDFLDQCPTTSSFKFPTTSPFNGVAKHTLMYQTAYESTYNNKQVECDSDDTQGDIDPKTRFSSSSSDGSEQSANQATVSAKTSTYPHLRQTQTRSRPPHPHSITFFGRQPSRSYQKSGVKSEILRQLGSSFVQSFKQLWQVTQQEQPSKHDGDNDYNIELRSNSTQVYKNQQDQHEAGALKFGGSYPP